LGATREGRTALEAEINHLKQEVEGAEGKKAEREAEGDGRTEMAAEIPPSRFWMTASMRSWWSPILGRRCAT